MSLLDSPYFKLFQRGLDAPDLAERFEVLRRTLVSVIQDVAVTQEMMRRKGGWDERLYRELRIETMLDDHNSTGGDPWRHGTCYRYTLDEGDFLRYRFRATQAEVDEFERLAEERLTRT